MAKLSSASVRLVQKMNRQNKFGEFPIYVVVCWKGRVEKACGVSCLSKFWDSKREVIKGGCPNAALLNKTLNDIKNRVIEKRNKFEYDGKRYTATMLLENYLVDLSVDDDVMFWNLCRRMIDERRLKDGTIRRYTYTYRKLCEFLGRKDFIIDELTLGVVKDFASWMERNDIKINTIKSLLACVAAVWNYAISKKLVDGDGYPFGEFKYTSKYKECPRDYFLEKSHIIRLRDYWLDLVIKRHGERWTYREGALDRLHNRCSAEFGILWFLMMFKMNGSAPVDVALIRPSDCKMVSIGGEDYWSIDIRRRKTARDVHIRLKRDLLVIIGFEHFMGFCDGHFVYPIINWKEKMSDRYFIEQCHHCSSKAIKHVKDAFMRINEDIARDNAMNGSNESVVDLNRLVMYTARHSFASQYLSSPNATVNGLASLMARSANTIATYVHQLTKDEEIAAMVDGMAI